MSKKSQKDAVVEEVLFQLPSFNKGQDNAVILLSHSQLETIKTNIANLISSGVVEYGKDSTNQSEVRAYARSMVMNHLKKAKELNGGNKYQPATSSTKSTSTTVIFSREASIAPKKKSLPKSINASLTPEDLQEFIINNLV